VDGSGAANRVAFWTDANTISSDANFSWEQEKLSLTADDVGVTNEMIHINNTSGNKALEFTIGSSNRGNLQIFDSDGTTEIMEVSAGRMTYTNGGNFGIATASPDEKLHVEL